MEELKRKRTSVKSQLTRFANLIDSLDISTLRIRLEKAEAYLDKYDEVQSEIAILTVQAKGDSAAQELDRQNFELNYFNVVSKARDIIKRANGMTSRSSRVSDSVPNEDNTESNKNNMNIRKLDVPIFDGDYENWISFRDSFLSMVDSNKSFSTIEKFHFLKQSVVKNAKRAIAAFTVTANNYAAAWEMLKSWYEDENELIFHHVRGIFEALPVKNNSHAELSLLMDTVNNHLQ